MNVDDLWTSGGEGSASNGQDWRGLEPAGGKKQASMLPTYEGPGRVFCGGTTYDGWRPNLSNITHSARTNQHPSITSSLPPPDPRLTDPLQPESSSANIKVSKTRPNRQPTNAQATQKFYPFYPDNSSTPPPLPEPLILIALVPTHDKIRCARHRAPLTQPSCPSKRQKLLHTRAPGTEEDEDEESLMIPMDDLLPFPKTSPIFTDFIVRSVQGPPISLSQPQPALNRRAPEVIPPRSFLYEAFAKRVEGASA
ncbi:hypothetical protein HGRIS_002658 [Hohenbuehelia grisea]|uniref:Uncharacterized protein n=1 Tax=Hohenbuehelia grisea TaxID=104357 RepID=A0ABR3JLB3_9AGAR